MFRGEVKLVAVIVAMTGASGAVLGVRTLAALRDAGVETHLVITRWAERTIQLEVDRGIDEVKALADHVYDEDDLAAPIASGSFKWEGMVVVPCSVKTLSAIANGFAHNLVARAADVTLKERRRLVLVVRETPLSVVHLENMLKVARAGAIVMPPNPAFYLQPGGMDDVVDCFTARVLDALGVAHGMRRRAWGDVQPPDVAAARAPGGTDEGPLPFAKTIGTGAESLSIQAFPAGSGAVIVLTGGDEPHIGAVAIAVPRPSLADPRVTSSTTSVYTVVGHKDDELARPIAENAARRLNKVVVVVAGVHVNAATPDVIARITRAAVRLSEDAIAALHDRGAR